MDSPVDNEGSMLGSHRANMNHHEMIRLLEKLEELWDAYTTNGSGPHGISSYHTEWLPLNKIENLLIEELCYEDQAEFESALCGSFADFLTNLPHVTLKEQDGTQYFQLKLDPPRSEWRPVKMTVKVNSSSAMSRVCLKSKWATIEIPELEFEISADGKRRTDSIHNHIAAAFYNLSKFVRQGNSGLSSDHKYKIMQTVTALNNYMEPTYFKPFTWIVHDPSGTCDFQPMEGVEVEWGEEATAAPNGTAAEVPPAAEVAPAAEGSSAAEKQQDQEPAQQPGA